MPASPYSSYPQGFPNGLLLRDVPIVQTNPGKVFWVYNGSVTQPGQLAGSNGNNGSFNKPFSTIAYALTQCTANRGDIIICRPGHAETIANATTLALNVAGVAIVGLGAGTLRPTLTFTTAATANIPVTAANVSIQNFRFIANFADIASLMTATGTTTPTDFNIEACEFADTDATHNALTIFTGNATANSCDGFRFARNVVSSVGTTAATTAIKILSTTNRLYVEDNRGCSAVLNDTAAILDGSTFQLTNFYLLRNNWERPNTSSTGGSFISGSGNAWVGHAADNYFYQVDNTAGIWISTGHGSSFGYSNNFSPITGAVDKSALINPAAV